MTAICNIFNHTHRIPNWVSLPITCVAAFTTLCVFIAYFVFPSYHDGQISRICSPSKKYDLVLIKTSGGPTSESFLWLHLVPYGYDFKEKEYFARVYDISNLSVCWKGDEKLVIKFVEADWKFVHNLVRPDSSLPSQIVEVMLDKVEDYGPYSGCVVFRGRK